MVTTANTPNPAYKLLDFDVVPEFRPNLELALPGSR
jgi:hypothetical protein